MKMRTLVVFGLAMGMVVACLGIATAAFTPVSSKSVTAEIEFTEFPSGTMTADLYNHDGTSAPEISWTGVTLGVTEWKAADQYIEVTNTYNKTGWGIQIYTDNLPSGTTEYNPAGLIATDDEKSVLPLTWRIMGEKVASGSDELDIQEVEDPVEPDKHHLQPSKYEGDVYYPWLWMKDASTPEIPKLYTTAFVNGEDYVTIWNETGVHHAEGPGDYYASPSPNYVYIGTRFTTATTPRIYRTSKLTVELFWQ